MKLMFCLPGASYSGSFLQCWTQLIHWCSKNGIEYVLSQKTYPNIYMVRNMCLGGDIRRGKFQKPFNGAVAYDYIVWIDSDILFNPKQLEALLAHDKNIVSGIYKTSNGIDYATVINCNIDYLEKNGKFQFLTDKQLGTELLECAYTGLGFMVIKKGVMEKISYPWFEPLKINLDTVSDFVTEDVTFCSKAQDAGFKVLVDPRVIVGHEKTVIL